MGKQQGAEWWTNAADQNMLRKLKMQGFLMQCFGWLIALACGTITWAGFATLDVMSELVYDLLALALTVGGIVLIVKGKRSRKLASLYPVYAIHLAHNPSGTIEEAARLMDEKEDVFRNTLFAMKRRGLLSELVLDVEHYRMSNEPSGAEPEEAGRYAAVKCPSCGATNKLAAGTVEACRYCGAHLSSPAH